MPKILKNFLAILLGVLVLWFTISYYDILDKIILLKDFNLLSFFISLIIIFIIYSLSGIQYNLILQSQDIKLKKVDLILFPITLNLWSFIIPFQGSLIFATLFFYKKYGRKLSTGISISFFLYFLTLSLSGILGLFFIIIYDKATFINVIILSLLSLFPIFFVLVDKVRFFSLDSIKNKLLLKLIQLYRNISKTLKELVLNPKLLIKVILIKLIKTILIGFWYWIISNELNYDLSFLVLVLLSLISEISLVFKITPDNIGINQLVAGGLLSSMGFVASEGIMITLVASAMTVVLIFTIGSLGSVLFIKEFKIKFSELNTFLNSKNKT